MALADLPGRFYTSTFNVPYFEAVYCTVVSIPDSELQTLDDDGDPQGTRLTPPDRLLPPTLAGLTQGIAFLFDAARVRPSPDAVSLILGEPIVLVEGSPATGISAIDLLHSLGKGGSDAIGAALGYTVIGNSPWLILSVPMGIILFRISREVGTAVGEVAAEWIKRLKPKTSRGPRKKPSDQR